MKKYIYILISLFLVCGVMSSCQKDDEGETGDGKLNLKLYLNEKVDHLSRATLEDSLGKSCIVYVYSTKGLIRKYQGLDNVPSEMWLVSGNYRAEAMAGDSVPASFTTKYYKGSSPFVIQKGATTAVNVECKIANVVTSVNFTNSVDSVLSNYKMTISNANGSLDFTKANSKTAKGYYMMDAADGDSLKWTITGTKLDGSQFSQTGSIPNVKGATEYALTVNYNGNSADVGGLYFTITVDESTIDINDKIELQTVPKIFGSGFDITKPVTAEPGALPKLSVYATATAALQELTISCPSFTTIGLAANEFNFFSMSDAAIAQYATAGVTYKYDYNSTDDNSIAKVSFAAELLNKLPEGTYAITIRATDVNGRYRTTTLTLQLTSAPVTTTAINALEVYAKHATIRGAIVKDGTTGVGFNYRKQGNATWTSVDGTTSGSTFSAALTGLTPGTTYEYVAKSTGFTGTDVKTFTTEAAQQLENAGFEDWQTSSAPYLLYASGGSMYWDSGNHGSSSLGKNITTPDGTVKHGGNYSVKMESQFVGVGIIGKFAAGNVFIGKYLATVGTDGVLGFGRPFNARPTALHGYVKYTPGSVAYTSSDLPSVSKGDTDKGIVYIALTDNSSMNLTVSGTAYSWTPQLICTKSDSRSLFNKDDSKIIAYGEKIFTEATSGDGMIEFTIPLTYKNTTTIPSNIIVVGSSSMYGDYFVGGNSTMWLDDLELIYE